MICPGNRFTRLSQFKVGSPEYAEIVQHLDECEQCQQAADSELSFELGASDMIRHLRDASEADLEHREYRSTIAINLLDSTVQEASIVDSDVPRKIIDGLQASGHPELLGRLGRYDVESVVGQGGMGVVLRAFDRDLHRVVALKILAPHLSSSAAARRRFAREAQAAAAVHHPNVLPIYDVEADAETPYLVMQYVPGSSLQARIEREGNLPVYEVLRIAKQTAEALSAAHDQGLIHRDVKPANILLENETDRVVLGDFGLARTTDDASLTKTGVVAGTPHYMSPEQAAGDPITAQSDLFSLGSVMYTMLTGRPPFRGESAMSVLHNVCSKRHTPINTLNNEVPRELARLIDGLLAKKPGQRYGSAAIVARNLEQLLSQFQLGRLRLGGLRAYRLRFATASLMGCAIVLAIGWGSGFFSAAVRHSVPSNSSNRLMPESASSESTPGTAKKNNGSASSGIIPMPKDSPVDNHQPENHLVPSPTGVWRAWDRQLSKTNTDLSLLEVESQIMSQQLPASLQSAQAHDPWNSEQTSLKAQLDMLERESAREFPSIPLLAPSVPSQDLQLDSLDTTTP